MTPSHAARAGEPVRRTEARQGRTPPRALGKTNRCGHPIPRCARASRRPTRPRGLMGTRCGAAPLLAGERTVRPLPRGCLHVERIPNEDRPRGREPAVLTSRRAVRNLFLGAGRSTRRRRAQALGQPVPTLQSCLVQPMLAATEMRKNAAQTKGSRQSLSPLPWKRRKMLPNFAVRLLTFKAIELFGGTLIIITQAGHSVRSP